MLLYNIIVRHINLLQKWFLKHNFAEDTMQSYETVIESEEAVFQRKLASDRFQACVLAALLGAFTGGCISLIIYGAFTPEAIPMIEHGVSLGTLFSGLTIGAIVGVILVRRI